DGLDRVVRGDHQRRVARRLWPRLVEAGQVGLVPDLDAGRIGEAARDLGRELRPLPEHRRPRRILAAADALAELRRKGRVARPLRSDRDRDQRADSLRLEGLVDTLVAGPVRL